jgi:hypothetical protein
LRHKYALFLLLLVSLQFSFSSSKSVQGESDILKKSYITQLLNQPEVLTVTNINNKTSLNITLPIESVISPKFAYLDVQVKLLNSDGFLSIDLFFKLANQNRTYAISRYDFDPTGQIVIDFLDPVLRPGDKLNIIMELKSESYFNRELEYSLLIESINLYLVTPPVFNAIIVPITIVSGDSKIFFDLSDQVIYFSLFVPQDQAFSVNITTNELIKLKYLRIEDVDWVNIQSDYVFTNNESLSFMSRDEDVYDSPKVGALGFSTYNNLPLKINLSTKLITLDSVTFLPSISNNDKILVYGINALIVGVPLVKLTRDRRKKTIIKS